ncbi:MULTISPECIES: hypothetical protein [Bradyrhizobium]|jgi:hypothetical protein|uniref:hypothetical protein n=1 Tax=Bradyrhizobium TaxID=374 RepID=UPI0012BB8DAF|nr:MULTISPECIES: hypothetical protein [Bradyrhizobium]MCS3450192.1 hypothetical protein [Bradyrhizobium elkanii]MCS3558664.1 hypothetical protein [Bradyrhizobium elkanii]MCW2151489.1 hypothetical protein [Bradyrhizobium elkanii]MCW2358638.1 hypothetical protein [Bradyrhizobium elkanii]MCW2375220.1 hypothetical protein [Bradyrhizobium elkanii]
MMTGQAPASDQDLLERVRAASDALGNWLEQNDYAGNDPYQLDNIISQVGGRPIIGPLMHFARRTLKPYHALIPKRLFQAAPAIVMPQALGDSLAGEARQPDSKVSRRRAARLLTLLEDTRSPLARNAAWGLPFNWGGTGKHPKHWPTTITSTIVLTGLLDAIHLLDRDRGLALLESGIRFMLEEAGMIELPEGAYVYFGPGDTRLIINASVAAAGLLARAGRVLDRDELVALAGRAALFAVHHQNPDGSWFYAPAFRDHPVDTIIDSRHTGYIIEGLIEVNATMGDQRIADAIGRGCGYMQAQLIDGDKPRWSPEQTWPIDSHDVAQSILTALAYGDKSLAKRHMAFAMDRFYAGDGKFRYKAFENGNNNDAVFIRWTQAPMYKATSKYLANSSATERG